MVYKSSTDRFGTYRFGTYRFVDIKLTIYIEIRILYRTSNDIIYLNLLYANFKNYSLLFVFV